MYLIIGSIVIGHECDKILRIYMISNDALWLLFLKVVVLVSVRVEVDDDIPQISLN